MKNLLKVFTVLAIMLFSLGANAQDMKVSGTVYDTSGTQTLYQAMIMAVRVKDSLLLGFTRTNNNGEFTLTGFQVDTFTMVISHPRFDDKNIYIFGSADNSEINIPSIKMPSKAKELEEVMIYANKNPIFYKGDTLVYVADSFKVAEGAVVEDLLKKLPGIKIDKDGKITSQGQEINKVLVDGDEFFGSDPTVATKNLGADGVEQVQIYEKTDNETIGGSDEKIKVLDLKLKEEAKKGYFGRLSGASDFYLTPLNNYIGSRPFYEGELLFNKFNSRQKISVFALGSNTPRSSFGRGDLNKFGLSNESGANRNFWEPDNTNNSGGVPQTFKAGVYYSDKLGKNKNTDLLFNYSYYNDKMDSRTESNSQFFLSDTTYYTHNSTTNKTSNQSHQFNLNIESKIDSLTLIQFKPSVSFDTGYTDKLDSAEYSGETGVESLRTQVQNTNDSKGLKVNNTTRLYRKFKKKRRELEVRYDLVLSNNQTDGKLYTKSERVLLSQVDTINQNKVNDNSSTSHYGTISYFEPISKRMKVNVNYLYEYGMSNQTKETYDAVTGAKIGLFSNIFDNTRMQNRGGAELIFENSKHYVSGGAYVRNINIDNYNVVSDTNINQNINNLLPKFKYEYKPSMSKRFTVNYNTSSQQPTVNDLAPVQDNTNPNRIQIGNPDLKPNYTHTAMVNFNTWNALSGKYIWSGVSMNYTNNAFANSTDYDVYGRTTSKTVNVDGNMNVNLYAGGGYPILNRKIEFQPSFSSSFIRSKNFVSGMANTTDNYSLTPEMDIDFQWDSLEIGLKSSYSYNYPISSLNTISSSPFSTEKYSVDVKWTLPKGFIIKSEGTFNRNTQIGGSGAFNRQFFIWNAEFSKKFLKTQNLLVSLVGNDILNQNVSAARTVTGNQITDNKTTIISRYFLMKVTYRFNNRKTREEDFKGMH